MSYPMVEAGLVPNNYQVEVGPLVHNTCIEHGTKVYSICGLPSYSLHSMNIATFALLLYFLQR
jgi:hypothetical protein